MRVSVLTMQNRAMLWCDLLLARVAVALRALVAPLGEALAVERVAARKDHHRRRLHRIARRPPRRAGGGGPRAEGGREYEQGDAQCRTAPSVGSLLHSLCGLLAVLAVLVRPTTTGVLPASARVSGAVAHAPARRTRAGRRLRWTCTAARCSAAEYTVSAGGRWQHAAVRDATSNAQLGNAKPMQRATYNVQRAARAAALRVAFARGRPRQRTMPADEARRLQWW